MAVKHQKQNKFLKIVAVPVKVLGKARDLYVNSMKSCEFKADYSLMSGQLPTRYSMDSSQSDDYAELVRAASVRTLGHRNEIDMLLHQAVQAKLAAAAKPLPKSCSAGLMGRIDEDKAEDDGGFYLPSKNYAVWKNTAAF